MLNKSIKDQNFFPSKTVAKEINTPLQKFKLTTVTGASGGGCERKTSGAHGHFTANCNNADIRSSASRSVFKVSGIMSYVE